MKKTRIKSYVIASWETIPSGIVIRISIQKVHPFKLTFIVQYNKERQDCVQPLFDGQEIAIHPISGS